MIKQPKYSYYTSIQSSPSGNELAFVRSVDALGDALVIEYKNRLDILRKMYGIKQEVSFYLHIDYQQADNTTKDQNEYKSDVNPF